MNIRTTCVVALLLGVLLTVLLAGGLEGQGTRSGRAGMEDILRTLRAAFSLSLAEDQFEAQESQATIRDALETLQDGADVLRRHGAEEGGLFAPATVTMARRAEGALDLWEAGETHAARLFLIDCGNLCVTCHWSLPEESANPLGRVTLGEPGAVAMPNAAQLSLVTALHQFEDAADLAEGILYDPGVPMAESDGQGYLNAYIRLTIRDLGDLRRARSTIQILAGRSDTPAYLTTYFRFWLGATTMAENMSPNGNWLEQAMVMIAEGEGMNRTPGDRRGFAYFAYASHLLHRLVNSDLLTADLVPQVYFLLGRTESYLFPGDFPPEAQFYLKIAIRSDPSSAFALPAYRLLMDVTARRYSSGDAGVPLYVQQELDELRTMIEKS